MATMTFKNAKSRSVGNALTIVGGYTVPAATSAVVIGLVLANTTASTQVRVDVAIWDGVNMTYLVKNCDIPAGGSVSPPELGKVVLQTGEAIRILSDTSASVDAVLSFMEIA